MKKSKLFYLRNQMLVANGIANFIGVFLAFALIHRAEPFPKELLDNPIIYWTDTLFDPFGFSFVIVMTLLYEKPIRHYLNALSRRTSISEDLKLKARQRLLNEPFVLIALGKMDRRGLFVIVPWGKCFLMIRDKIPVRVSSLLAPHYRNIGCVEP